MPRRIEWPRDDYSRIPFWLYHDEEIYAQEMEKIFRGPVWSYLVLEAELPNPGDYRTCWVGDTQVVVSRDAEGNLHGFINRCSHRGAQLVRKPYGNAKEHICIYHRWCYSNKGELIGIPFRRGLGGKGGMTDFELAPNSPRHLRVTSYRGVVFGTFSDEAEPLEEYLGEFGRATLDRLFHKPVRILGYQRQMIYGNWKLYNENLLDSYHAVLLHQFFVTFGLNRATMRGGTMMDTRHRHNDNYAHPTTDTEEQARSAYQGVGRVAMDALSLRDPALVGYIPEFAEGRTVIALTLFPNAFFLKQSNMLQARQIRPKGKDAVEVHQTTFGYEGDDEEMTKHRLRQANLAGPAGYVTMEDGEAIEIVHRATAREGDSFGVVEMGGRGALVDLESRINDIPIRGFWSNWSQLMGVEPAGGVR